MTVHNADIATLFERMADLLEIEEANPFRVRAYRRAAATVQELPVGAAELVSRGEDLTELPGIGKDLAGKIAEIVQTGRMRMLEEVEARTPSTLASLTSIPGLGPRRVHQLYDKLGIRTLDELARAAREGRLRRLPRFGAGLEARILKELGERARPNRRFRISTAEDFAGKIKAYLETALGTGQVVEAGSFRRRRETVGDLDVLATAADGQGVIDRFVAYEEVDKVLAKGPTRSTVLLRSGLQVDLRVVPEESYGAALVYFTGSKAHNIALRMIGHKRGLKINEYGVFRGATPVAGRTEAEVYAAVGLPLITPELRENRGELEAAAEGRLPNLVGLDDIRGDLHVHTRASDGKSTLDELAEAAEAMGYDYLAVTDHTRQATVAHGLDPLRLSLQLDEIDRLNDRGGRVRMLKSAEVDILADGGLDLPDSILKRLDLVVGAVHYRFDLDAARQTERIIRAMDNRYFNILAHPTGRMIEERSAYPVDLAKVMEAAKARGCALELNAHPSRLDLDDVHCRAAREMGLKVVISSDAHSTLGLGAMRFGVDQARRGWLEREDVLNTRSWPDVKSLLAR